MSVNQVNQSTGALSPIAGGTLYADAPVGSIQAYGGATAPFGWLLCQGQAVSRATYAELFGVIGTSFGSGDGSTTFNVPDLRDKFPEGASNTNTLGSAKSAGLPNITGNASLGYNDSSAIGVMTRSANGAFVTQKDGSTYWSGPAANIGTYDNSFHFDASRSNSIYGKSTTVQPPAVCVNYIIKATTISLPSDFEDAVDEKIAANIVDSIADGNMKAATSNAVYDAITSSTTNSIADGNTKAITSNAIYNQILTEIRSYGDKYYTEKTNITFVADVAQNVTHTINNLPAGRYMVFYKVWNGESSRFKLYNYTEGQGTWEGTWSGTNYKFVGVIANHSGGNYSKITNWKQLEANNTIASIGMLLVKIGSYVSN